MCVPTAVLAYCVSRFLRRSSHARWPAMLQAALASLGAIGYSAALALELNAHHSEPVKALRKSKLLVERYLVGVPFGRHKLGFSEIDGH